MNVKSIIYDAVLTVLLSLFYAFALLLPTGCETIQKHEDDARLASQWVRVRSGFIENAVMAITHVAVYSTEPNTEERLHLLDVIHTVTGNVNALVASGNVDAESIQRALKIEESYFAPTLNAISSIIQGEIETFKDNGYAELAIEVLAAVSKGMSNGTVQ